MKNYETRKTNQFEGMTAFISDSIEDFPADSPAGIVAARMRAGLERIHSLAAIQASGAVGEAYAQKGDNFQRLKALMRKMDDAADTMGDEIEGIEELFRTPRKGGEDAWIASGRAFYNNSEDHVEKFTKLYLPVDFREQLIGLVDAVEAENVDIAREQKSGATGGIESEIRSINKDAKKLIQMVKNKFDDNPQKLSAWRTASHLEKAPEKKKVEPPTS